MRIMIPDYYDDPCDGTEVFAFRLCECGGENPFCEECEGKGRVHIPFLCFFPYCKQAFDTPEELSVHMQEAHGAAPLQLLL